MAKKYKKYEKEGWTLYTRECIIEKTKKTIGAVYQFTQRGVTIPEQLQDKKYRFLKIRTGEKKPVEEDWNITYNYKYDEPEF